MEGTTCPTVERPGSLEQSIPSVVEEIEVAAGARLKIIADFERNRVIVRGE